jgi:spore maturation protein CgeB
VRLLKLGVYHPTYLRQFYAARPALAAAPYAAQHAALIRDAYGSSDFWTSALARFGYETCDTVANAEPLQRAWAREQGLTRAGDDWLRLITAAQVTAFRPDALIVADYSTFDAAFIRRLRAECPSIRLVLGWCGAPYRDAGVFAAWDIVLSCVPELVAHFRAAGHRSHQLHHAFEPRILERLDTASPPGTDFSFIGSILKQNQFHVGREKILKLLVERTDLQIWSDLRRPTGRERRGVRARQLAHDAVSAARTIGVPESLLAAAPILNRAARWESRPAHEVDERIARRARPPLFGLAMFQRLRDSRATLNTHIDISADSASNMRLFEATGVGACLVTDWKENLPELFEPDAEVLTYRTAEECAEKVTYILAHEGQRRSIAAAGQRRTLRDHNFTHRAARIDEIIRGALSKP